MKRFNLFFILMFLFFILIFIGLSGCSSKHICCFDRKIIRSDYFCSFATYEEPESYFYSCICGNKSDTQKFYVGSARHEFTEATCTEPKTCTRCSETVGVPLGHNYIGTSCTDNGSCSRCSKIQQAFGHNYETIISWTKDFSQCTAALVCKNNHEHILKEETVITSYVKDSDALCLTPEKGHYVGVFSSSEFNNIKALSKSITKGNSLGHSFTNYVLDNNATCTKDGTKTAVCDRCSTKNTVTVFGTKTSHKYTEKITSSSCLYKESTCTTKALYYYSCACGKIGTNTFEYGNLIEHDYVYSRNDDFLHTISCKNCNKHLTEQHVYTNNECVCGHEKYSSALEFSLNSDNKSYNVSVGKCTDTEIIIPNTYNGLPVTAIAKQAFSGCYFLTTVTIPNNVTVLDEGAFSSCYELISITLGKGVKTIKSGAFDNNYNLTNVNYLGTINDWAQIDFLNTYANPLSQAQNFYINNTLQTNITINTEEINDFAFYGCGSLKNVVIGNNVKNIGERAFCGCSSLTNITISANLKNINKYTFSSCSSLTSVTLPEGVTNINEFAFCGCNNLTNITIPKSVKSIGVWAFEGCSKLSKVNYTGTIDSWVQINLSKDFANPLIYSHKLYINNILQTNITINTTEINDLAFCGCNSLTSVVIGNSVANIGEYAFFDCSLLKNLTIGNSVKTIGESAFKNCTSLTSIKIPNSVTSIGESAFYNCEKLKSVTFDSNSRLYKIECETFYGCSSLTSIVIPTTVTSIGNKAFYGCDNLESVEFECTSLWFVSTYEGGYSNVILVDYPIRNALHLTTTYCDYYWYCK